MVREIQVGDTVEQIRRENIPGQFTFGNRYVVRHYDPPTDCRMGSLSVVADDSGNPNGWAAVYFKLVDPEGPW